ncbi:hypothetical protein E1H18_3837 [Caulobacter sp. RHG1]|nr:hypothetical protein [Caulobacter sp. RHG1]
METLGKVLAVIGPLLGALVGGGFALLGAWLADRRKQRNDEAGMQRRERALLTGMFAVRNHIATRLDEFEAGGQLSTLSSLRTAQSYVHRLIDKAPGESEGLMISVIEIGLKLDAALATISAPPLATLAKSDGDWWRRLKIELDELVGSLHQFDATAGASLTFLDEADLARLSGGEALTSA